MPNNRRRNLQSQASTKESALNLKQQLTEAMWGLQRPIAGVPCEGQPLVQAVCGCRSVGLIQAAIAKRGVCPLDAPWDCPMRRLAGNGDGVAPL